MHPPRPPSAAPMITTSARCVIGVCRAGSATDCACAMPQITRVRRLIFMDVPGFEGEGDSLWMDGLDADHNLAAGRGHVELVDDPAPAAGLLVDFPGSCFGLQRKAARDRGDLHDGERREVMPGDAFAVETRGNEELRR